MDARSMSEKMSDDIQLIRKITRAYRDSYYSDAERMQRNLREQRDAIIEEIHNQYDGYIRILELLMRYQETENPDDEKEFLSDFCSCIIDAFGRYPDM